MGTKRKTPKEYAALGGVRCPVCNSVELEGESVDIDSGSASQEVHCLDCAATWVDEYILTGYTNLETE